MTDTPDWTAAEPAKLAFDDGIDTLRRSLFDEGDHAAAPTFRKDV